MVDPITPPARADVPAAAPPGRPVVLPDGWTVTLTDKIVSTVDSVRAKTTAPITLVARGLVYGLVLATAGIAALVLLVALLLRGLHVLVDLVLGWFPGEAARAGRSVWIVDLVLGLGLLLVGAWCMRKGRIPAPEE